jgi:hypothetical protein
VPHKIKGIHGKIAMQGCIETGPGDEWKKKPGF